MNRNDWVNFTNLFPLLSECYGDKFEVNDAKIKLWGTLLAEYEFNDIHTAVMKHMTASSFAPKPADIVKLMSPDFDESFNRMIRGEQPINNTERATRANVGYACKTQLPEVKARELYTKEYKRQLELSKQPYTPQERQIAHTPEKRPTDQMVDENINRFKGKSKEEILQMMNNFKTGSKVKK